MIDCSARGDEYLKRQMDEVEEESGRRRGGGGKEVEEWKWVEDGGT